MNKTVEQAEAALASANAALLSELERDCERSEGSGAQERRREERQQSLRDAVDQCERDLEVAKRQAIATAPEPSRTDAWWEGFHARREKKPSRPPYGIGTQEYSDWSDGWVAGAD